MRSSAGEAGIRFSDLQAGERVYPVDALFVPDAVFTNSELRVLTASFEIDAECRRDEAPIEGTEDQ